MPYRIHERLAWQLVAGEAVIVDLSSGNTIGLNESASMIWSMLTEHDESEIAATLSERYGIDRENAARDVAEFVNEMKGRDYLLPS
jgi:hypothetical protein